MDDKFLYQNKILKEWRKELRNNLTDAEYLLWQKLKGSKLGFKFTRQYSVGPYILDFYCPQFRLAIELDGGVHNTEESKTYDKERDEYLKNHDIVTIRFWNSEVSRNLEKVVETITKSLEERSGISS